MKIFTKYFRNYKQGQGLCTPRRWTALRRRREAHARTHAAFTTTRPKGVGGDGHTGTGQENAPDRRVVAPVRLLLSCPSSRLPVVGCPWTESMLVPGTGGSVDATRLPLCSHQISVSDSSARLHSISSRALRPNVSAAASPSRVMEYDVFGFPTKQQIKLNVLIR